MAVARVQDSEIFGTNVTTQTRTLNGVAAGSTLIASAVYGSSSITFTIADNAGGTWNTVSPINPFTNSSPTLRGYIWYAANHPGGNVTITWTPSSAVSCLVGCVEYSGADTSTPVPDGDGAFNNSTSHATPTLTRARAGCIYAIAQSGSNATWTAGTDFTDIGTGGSARGFHESTSSLASGDRTASATSAATEEAIIIAVVIQEPAGGAAPRRIFVVG